MVSIDLRNHDHVLKNLAQYENVRMPNGGNWQASKMTVRPMEANATPADSILGFETYVKQTLPATPGAPTATRYFSPDVPIDLKTVFPGGSFGGSTVEVIAIVEGHPHVGLRKMFDEATIKQ